MASLPHDVSTSHHPTIIFGTASFGSGTSQAKFNTPEKAAEVLSLLKRHNITTLDTARAYPVGSPGTAEALLGTLHAASGQGFTVSTKVTSWDTGAHSYDNIRKSVDLSLETLGTHKVETMYLHAPDRTTPFEETCRAMDSCWREGKFERFGLSNFSAAEVEEVCAICEKGGWVRPRVYQGRYNPIVRGGEEELFPVLRRWGMGFWAYSPSAAGLFSGAINEASVNVTGSRWDSNTSLGVTYKEAYLKPRLIAAATRVADATKAAGLDGHSVALRWTVFHSILEGPSSDGEDSRKGDGVVLGASSVEQLRKNLEAVEAGPLSEELAKLMDGVWEEVKVEAAKYHM